ncbi:ABC transporter permease [Sphingobium limneticum]|uniref:ABC transporter permease n=2 Tax=Sphingomonadaceae TaxID=41297 RepID=A0A5J5HYH2_9SPHN|nr:ABC transporter permease [Sphingobium limneticum]KAA9014465.1 ABC transporter permease [Sphingobium limneticum]KAA9027197.1 ABC transporter permease [Sphingobium limneticum]MBU0931823.1 ABC transporter permease [Alphaproteobacteria bacterium]
MKAALTLIGKRFASSLLTLLLVSVTIFIIAQLLPGDAAQEALGQSATPQQVAALRHEMGLDRPAYVRYASWLTGMVSGDPGQSLVANMPVSDVISERLPNSLLLAALTALVAVPVALAIGIGSAMNRGGRLDRALNVATLSMVAVPEFLVATIAVLIFSVKLRWLPSIAMASQEMGWGDYLRGVAMPILTLSVIVIAQMARMTRAAVIDQMDRPYVEMAVLKGVAPVQVVLRHIMPNAIAPIVNAMALSLSYLLGGAVIVETIFNYPGLASLMVNAVTSRDMPLLQACAMIFCAAYLLLMLIADVTAILANPRLRAQ